MAYNVSYGEAQVLQNDLAGYMLDLGEQSRALTDAIGRLEALSSFRGAAADSIKAYFASRKTLVDDMLLLCRQLSCVFAVDYVKLFGEAPVSETDPDAQWPSAVMKQTEGRIDAILDGDLADAEAAVRRALEAAPSGVSLPVPNAGTLRADLERQRAWTRDLRLGVRDVEQKGTASLTQVSSEFDAMRSALARVIDGCAKGAESMVAFDVQRFSALTEESGLGSATARASECLDANWTAFIDSLNTSLDSEIESLRRAFTDARETQVISGVAMLVIAIASLGTACVGLAAKASASTPAVIGGIVGVGFKSWSVKKKMDEIEGVVTGTDEGVTEDERPYYYQEQVPGELPAFSRDAPRFEPQSGPELVEGEWVYRDPVKEEAGYETTKSAAKAVYDLAKGDVWGSFGSLRSAASTQAGYRMDMESRVIEYAMERRDELVYLKDDIAQLDLDRNSADRCDSRLDR